MTDIEELFLQEKPARILVGLREEGERKYASVLSKEADCTYSHTVKILDTFKELGLVSFEKEGRKKLVSLTDRGDRIASAMEALVDSMQ